jgi:predicted transcriptional regulator
MVGGLPVFKDLQEAIDNVVAFIDEQDHWSRLPTFLLEDLKKVSHIYFVEPKDDEEFNEWQNEQN